MASGFSLGDGSGGTGFAGPETRDGDSRGVQGRSRDAKRQAEGSGSVERSGELSAARDRCVLRFGAKIFLHFLFWLRSVFDFCFDDGVCLKFKIATAWASARTATLTAPGPTDRRHRDRWMRTTLLPAISAWPAAARCSRKRRKRRRERNVSARN